MAEFDYLGAKQAGASDEEIQSFLKANGTDFDLIGAKNAGATDDEISTFLKSQPVKKKEVSKPTTQVSSNGTTKTSQSSYNLDLSLPKVNPNPNNKALPGLGQPFKPEIALKSINDERKFINAKTPTQTNFQDYNTVINDGIKGQNKFDNTTQILTSQNVIPQQAKKEFQQLQQKQQVVKDAKKDTRQNILAAIPELADAKNTDEAISTILKSDMKNNLDYWQQFDDEALLGNDENTLNDFLVSNGLKNQDRELYLKEQASSNPKYGYEYEYNKIGSLFKAVKQRADDYDTVLKQKFGDNYMEIAKQGNSDILNDQDFNKFRQLREKQNELSTKANGLINDSRYSEVKSSREKVEKAQQGVDERAKNDKVYKVGDELNYIGNKLAYGAGHVVKMIAELPSLATSIDKGYDWTDKVADWGNRFSDNLIESIPVSTDKKTGVFNKVADVDGYKVFVDESGEPLDVRDKNNFKVPLSVSQSVVEKFSSNPQSYKTRNEMNSGALVDNGLNTMIDMGIMILGTKGAGMVGAGEKLQKLTSMGIAYQQTKRDVFNDAIKKGLDPRNADLLSNIIGVAAGTSSMLNPMEFNIAKGAGLFNLLKTDGLNAAKLALIKDGKLSVKDYAKEFVSGAIKNTIGENIEELGIENTTQAIANNHFNNQISETDMVDGGLDDRLHILDKQGLETFLITAGSSFLMTPIEINSQTQFNQQEAMKMAIENPEDFAKIKELQLKQGQISQQQFDNETKIYNDVSKTYNAVKDDVKEELQPQLLALLTKKSNLSNKISEIKDEVLSKPYKDQLEQVNKGIESISVGKNADKSLVAPIQQSEILAESTAKEGSSTISKTETAIANKISKGEELTPEEKDYYEATKDSIDKLVTVNKSTIQPINEVTEVKEEIVLPPPPPEIVAPAELDEQQITQQLNEVLNEKTTPTELTDTEQEINNSERLPSELENNQGVQQDNGSGQVIGEEVPTEKVEEKVDDKLEEKQQENPLNEQKGENKQDNKGLFEQKTPTNKVESSAENKVKIKYGGEDKDLKGNPKKQWMLPTETSEQATKRIAGFVEVSDFKGREQSAYIDKKGENIEVKLRNDNGKWNWYEPKSKKPFASFNSAKEAIKYIQEQPFWNNGELNKDGRNDAYFAKIKADYIKTELENGNILEDINDGKISATEAKLIIESAGLKVPKEIESLLSKETTKAETPTTNTGVEEGSGVGGDVEVKEDSKKWYKAEKKVADKDGNEITLTIDKNKDDNHFYIKAKDASGKEVGSALFETSNGNVWSGNEIEVNESNRRKGIMSAMYDFAESEGHPLEPTKSLSKEGKAFWENRKQSIKETTKAETKNLSTKTEEITPKSSIEVDRNVDRIDNSQENIEISSSKKLKTNGSVEEGHSGVFGEDIVDNKGNIVGSKISDTRPNGGKYYQTLVDDTPENRKGFGWQEHQDIDGKIFKKFETLDDLEKFIDSKKEQLKETPISKTETTENPALKDVEATAKALEGVDTFHLVENEGEWKATTKTYRGREIGNWAISNLDKKQQKEYLKIRDEADTYGTKEQAEENLKKLKDFEQKNKEAFERAKQEIDALKEAEERKAEERKKQQNIFDQTEQELNKLSDKEFDKLVELIDEKRRQALEQRFGDRVEKRTLFRTPISEAYHKAKADGSNPELVKAVEDLIGKPTAQTPENNQGVQQDNGIGQNVSNESEVQQIQQGQEVDKELVDKKAIITELESNPNSPFHKLVDIDALRKEVADAENLSTKAVEQPQVVKLEKKQEEKSTLNPKEKQDLVKSLSKEQVKEFVKLKSLPEKESYLISIRDKTLNEKQTLDNNTTIENTEVVNKKTVEVGDNNTQTKVQKESVAEISPNKKISADEVSVIAEKEVEREINHIVKTSSQKRAGLAEKNKLLKKQKETLLADLIKASEILLEQEGNNNDRVRGLMKDNIATREAFLPETLTKETIAQLKELGIVVSTEKAKYNSELDKLKIDIVDDGSIKIPQRGIFDVIEMIEKEFPTEIKDTQYKQSTTPPKVSKNRYYTIAQDYNSIDIPKKKFEDAKDNLETAKKSGNKKLIEVMQENLNEAKAIYDIAKDLDYTELNTQKEVQKSKPIQGFADATDIENSGISKRDIYDAYKVFNKAIPTDVNKSTIEDVIATVFANNLRKQEKSITDKQTELAKKKLEVDVILDKYKLKNGLGYKKPTTNSAVFELNRALRDLAQIEYESDFLKDNSKEINKLLGEDDVVIVTEDIKENPINKIEDIGEKIGGAKKDLSSRLSNVTTKDIESQPLSKSFPEPNYKELVNEGVITKDEAIFLKYLYDNIPSKPRKSYRLASWVSKVQNAIDTVKGILGSETLKKELLNGAVTEKLGENYKKHKEILEAFGFPETEVNLGGYEITKDYSRGNYMITKGNFIIKSGFETINDAVIALKINNSITKNKEKQVKFSVYKNTETGEFYIGKKGATSVVKIMGGIPQNIKEAHQYLKENQEKFESIWNGMKNNPNERRFENRTRVGTDWRNGENISGDKFIKTFGFRGVEFGNWVNNSERQQSVNDAYDALMDMANLLGISPNAVSLNGELGFAFGARGSGKASAHYESGKVVINLTKTKGAGSLGHEWFHALDNYFSRVRGYKSNFITDSPVQYTTKDGQKDKSIRVEVLDKFKDLTKVIRNSGLPKRSRELDKTRSQPYWSTTIEMGARAFENFIIEKLAKNNETNDYLANFKETSEWINDSGGDIDATKNYPYPLETESESINKAFQDLFDTIQERKEDDKSILFSIENESTNKQFTPIQKSKFNELLDKLKKAFPNVKVELFGKSDFDNARKELDKRGIVVTDTKTKDGTIYGFKTPDGKVFLNSDAINANTPIHEFGHVWQSVFPNEFAKGISLLVQSPQGRELINEIRKNPAYKGKSITEIQAEALVTAIGNKGETIFNSNPSLYNKFKQWLNDLFAKIGDKLGIKNLSPDDKFDMFTKKVVGELLGGKVLDSKVGTETKSGDVDLQFKPDELTKKVQELRDFELTDSEIRDYLLEAGNTKQQIDDALGVKEVEEKELSDSKQRVAERIVLGNSTEVSDTNSNVGVKKRITDARRESLGLKPVELPKLITDKTGMAMAKNAVDNGLVDPIEIESDIVQHEFDPTYAKVSRFDLEVLKYRRLQLEQKESSLFKSKIEINEALSKNPDDVDLIAQQLLTQEHIKNNLEDMEQNTLASRIASNVFANLGHGLQTEYNLEGEIQLLIKKIKNNYGENLPEDVKKKLSELEAQNKELVAKNEQIIKRYNDDEALKTKDKFNEAVRKEVDKILKTKYIQKQRLKGKDLIASGVDKVASALGVRLMAEGNERPSLIQGLAEIAQGLIDEGAATISNVMDKLGDYISDKFGDKIKFDEYREDVAEAVENNLDKFSKSVKKSESIDDLTSLLKKKMKELVAKGIESRTEIIENIYEEVKKAYTDNEKQVDFDKRKISDLLSDYGKKKFLSDHPIDVKVRDIKRQLKLASAIEDVLVGNAPLKSGLIPDKISDTVRRMTSEVKDLMKKKGIETQTPEQKWKTALDAIKTRLQNEINDLEKQKEDGKRFPKKTIGIEYDKDANDLKEKRDALKLALDNIIGKEGQIKETIDEIKRIAKSDNATTITKSMVKSGLISDLIRDNLDTGVKPGELLEKVTSSLKDVLPDITEEQLQNAFLRKGDFKSESKTKTQLQKDLADLKSQLSTQKKIDDLKNGIATEIKKQGEKSDEVKKLQKDLADQKRKSLNEFANLSAIELQRLINITQNRINKGDFVTPKYIKAKFQSDLNWVKNNQQLENIKHELRMMESKALDEKKSTVMKALDIIDKWAIKTVFFGTYGYQLKLGSTALSSIIHKPFEDLLGGIIYNNTFKNIAKNAPIEGNTKNSAKSLKNYYKEIARVDKWLKSIWQIASKGETTLDKQMDKMYSPNKFGDFDFKDKNKIQKIGEFISKTIGADHIPIIDLLTTDPHAMIKEPIKRATYESAYNAYMNWVADNMGSDAVNDPLVLQTVKNSAFLRAKSEIFMGNSLTENGTANPEGWTGFLSRLNDSIMASRTEAITEGNNAQYALSSLYKFFLPIVKVPTNIITRAIKGNPIILTRNIIKAINTNAKIENGDIKISNEEADAIIRDLKKGTITSAYWIAGFLLAGAVAGGFYNPFYSDEERKRRRGVAKSNEILLGQKKHSVTDLMIHGAEHTSQVTALMLGATFWLTMKHYNIDEKESLGYAIEVATAATLKATGEQHPIFNFASDFINATQSERGLKRFGKDIARRFDVERMLKVNPADYYNNKLNPEKEGTSPQVNSVPVKSKPIVSRPIK